MGPTNKNPRKFRDKIALQNKLQDAKNLEFLAIMKEVSGVKVSRQCDTSAPGCQVVHHSSLQEPHHSCCLHNMDQSYDKNSYGPGPMRHRGCEQRTSPYGRSRSLSPANVRPISPGSTNIPVILTPRQPGSNLLDLPQCITLQRQKSDPNIFQEDRQPSLYHPASPDNRRQPLSYHPASPTDRKPISYLPASLADRQPVSYHPASSSDRQPISYHPASPSDGQPISYHPASPSDRQPISYLPASPVDRQQTIYHPASPTAHSSTRTHQPVSQRCSNVQTNPRFFDEVGSSSSFHQYSPSNSPDSNLSDLSSERNSVEPFPVRRNTTNGVFSSTGEETAPARRYSENTPVIIVSQYEQSEDGKPNQSSEYRLDRSESPMDGYEPEQRAELRSPFGGGVGYPFICKNSEENQYLVNSFQTIQINEFVLKQDYYETGRGMSCTQLLDISSATVEGVDIDKILETELDRLQTANLNIIDSAVLNIN